MSMIEEEVAKAAQAEVNARIGEHVTVPLEQQAKESAEKLEQVKRAFDNS